MRFSVKRERKSVASGNSGNFGVEAQRTHPKNIAELLDMHGNDNNGGGWPAESDYHTAPPGTDEQYFHAAPSMVLQSGETLAVDVGGKGTACNRKQATVKVTKKTISCSAGKAVDKRSRSSARSYLAAARGTGRRAGSIPNELVKQVKVTVGLSEKIGFVQTRDTLSLSTQATYTDVSCMHFRFPCYPR